MVEAVVFLPLAEEVVFLPAVEEVVFLPLAEVVVFLPLAVVVAGFFFPEVEEVVVFFLGFGFSSVAACSSAEGAEVSRRLVMEPKRSPPPRSP